MIPASRLLVCFLPLLLANPLMARGQDPPPAEPPPAETAPEAPAQTPAPGDEKPDPAAEESPEDGLAEGTGDQEPSADDDAENKSKATIKVETDLACMVTIGLGLAKLLEPGDDIIVKVDPGPVQVRATAQEASEAAIVEALVLEAGDRHRIRLKMVKALADLRKIEARDRTYRDPDSRLMWPTRDNGAGVDWDAAGEYCEALQHGGWEDWRLPTLAELEGIEAMWSIRQFKTVDPIALTSCCAWSSDRIDEENAWNFNYRFRRPFRGHLRYNLGLRALCVRDGSDEIPENTRKNRRAAKRLAKEKRREKLRKQAEEAAAEKAAREAAEEEPDEPGEDPDGGSGEDGGQ